MNEYLGEDLTQDRKNLLIGTYPDKWNPDLKEQALEAAEKAKMNLSQWLRLAILEKIEKDKES